MPYEETHPWLTFSINLAKAPARLWTLLGGCNALCGVIDGAPLLPGDALAIEREWTASAVHASFASERSALTVAEVEEIVAGEYNAPPSRRYIVQEYANMAGSFRYIRDRLGTAIRSEITADTVREYNRLVLDRLVLAPDAAPGKFRTTDAPGEGGETPLPPAGDCERLIDSLCDWLNSRTFSPPGDMNAAYGILKAVLAHLYLAWIAPFGAGNRRTSSLVEFHLLREAGIPAPAAHALSIHYARTEPEYRRIFPRVTSPGGREQVFIRYAVTGMRDVLGELAGHIADLQADALWRHVIVDSFRDRTSPADLRRRDLALLLSELNEPVPLPDLMKTVPAIGLAYASRSYKTLSRDVNDLVKMGICGKKGKGVLAAKDGVRGFRISS
ncbi:MAG: Fic family protein [Candidatus Latescibacteria bacterium]|nr:Fic family protein [Candidatus Latescibacterota bacterium]